jgi:nucleoside-diphosphate-sugar epimerase
MITDSRKVIGLLGATGNLGSAFIREFQKINTSSDLILTIIGRPGKLSADFNIMKSGMIQSESGEFPHTIVNLSNYYVPNPTPVQDYEMEETILGVAHAISKTIRESACTVISASSYFQYCPDEFQPWSHYAEVKAKAKVVMQESALDSKARMIDFVLYDNFGGLNRKKFVDLLVESLANGIEIDCTNGDQVLNLTHISDLAQAFVSEASGVANSELSGVATFELKSDFTVNLRELVQIAEMESGRQARINWGAIPYREREVFQLWDTGFHGPINWNPLKKFGAFINHKFSTENTRNLS